jgi:hypothetical protein
MLLDCFLSFKVFILAASPHCATPRRRQSPPAVLLLLLLLSLSQKSLGLALSYVLSFAKPPRSSQVMAFLRQENWHCPREPASPSFSVIHTSPFGTSTIPTSVTWTPTSTGKLVFTNHSHSAPRVLFLKGKGP